MLQNTDLKVLLNEVIEKVFSRKEHRGGGLSTISTCCLPKDNTIILNHGKADIQTPGGTSVKIKCTVLKLQSVAVLQISEHFTK